MRQWIAIFAAAGVVAATLPLLRDRDQTLGRLLAKAKIAVTPEADERKPVDPPALTDLDLTNIDDRRDVVTAPAHGKRNADLTLDAVYQRAALGFLRRGKVYEGAIAMAKVRSGEVLVWASQNQGRRRDIITEATAPSASIFKIPTGAALIEAGVSLNEKFCYSGGEHGIGRRDLVPNERRDRYCASLPMAMGRSLNTIFARLANQHLDGDSLGSAAKRLGWGAEVPFDVPVAESTVELPEEELEFARTAAGFWNTRLSPWQGLNAALTVASGGEMIRMRIVERVVDEDGEEIYRRPDERQVLRRALDERTAWALTRMLEQTVRNGTSYRSFHDRAGRPFLPDIRVAGKTGTLTDKQTGTLYTWWVGFAPARKPEVALAVLVTNRGKWHVKGTHVAASMLQLYFADRDTPGVRYPYGYQGPKQPRFGPEQPAESPNEGDAATAETAPADDDEPS